MNWICIKTDGMPNDRGYALPVQCFVCNMETGWAGIAQCDRRGWFDVYPSIGSRDGNITHWAEVELPQDLSVKWPRDWGKVVMVRNNNGMNWRGPSFLIGCNGISWLDDDEYWEHCRLATPEEAGEMQPLTVPEEVRG